VLESSALRSGEKIDNFHDKRTGIEPAELSSLDAVGRIRELFSEHKVGNRLAADPSASRRDQLAGSASRLSKNYN